MKMAERFSSILNDFLQREASAISSIKARFGMEDSPTTTEIAQFLSANFEFVRIHETDDLLVLENEFKRKFLFGAEKLIKAIVSIITEDMASMRYKAEIIDKIRWSGSTRVVSIKEINQPKWIVPCRNGLLDLKKKLFVGEINGRVGIFDLEGREKMEEFEQLKEKVLEATDGRILPSMGEIEERVLKTITEKHFGDCFFTFEIPVYFDPSKRCPRIDKFLKEVIPDDAQRRTFYELAGYCLWRDYEINKVFFFQGDGANGKSTTLNLLTQFLGQENVVSVSLHDLTQNRFAAARLFGKLANLNFETSVAAFNTERLKRLTGRDMFTAERKFKEEFNFFNYAKLIFAANQLPPAYDPSYAFARRLVLIDFPNKFEGKKADKNIIDKITTKEELSGFLNKVIRYLFGLLKKGEFFSFTSAKEMLLKFDLLSNPIKAFVTERIEVAGIGEGEISARELYAEYVRWCNQRQIPVQAQAKVTKELPRIIPGTYRIRRRTDDGNREYFWQGICWKEKQIERIDEIGVGGENEHCSICGKKGVAYVITYSDGTQAPVCEKCKEGL